jgi:DNA replication protein DnaC
MNLNCQRLKVSKEFDDGLKPAKEFKPQEFPQSDKPCPDCGGTDLYQNGICVPCHEEEIQGDRVDHYVEMLKKLPVKLRELEMVDLEKSPELIKMKSLIKESTDKRESVYLHGAVGNGKTSIMALLFKYQARKGILVDWVNVPDLMESIRQSYSKGYTLNDDIISRLTTTGANGTLFLDDLGAERVKRDAEISFVEEQLYRLINGLYERNGQVMIISNKKPSEIAEQVGDRIVSRLVEMCVQVENTLPDYRLKNVRK